MEHDGEMIMGLGDESRGHEHEMKVSEEAGGAMAPHPVPVPMHHKPKRIGADTIPSIDFEPQYQAKYDLTTLPEKMAKLPLEMIPVIPPGMVHQVTTVPEDYEDRQDKVNDLDQEITRDISCQAKDWFDAVRLVNHYPKSKITPLNSGEKVDSEETSGGVFTGSGIGKKAGMVLNVLTLSARYWNRRKNIPASHYGVYIEGGCWFTVAGPCYYNLTSTTARWADLRTDGFPPVIPMDDPDRLVRTLGSKTVMMVPENHVGIAKCYKNRETMMIGNKNVSEEYQPGDTVLIPEGIHVFPEEYYSEVEVVNLSAGPGAPEYVNENMLRLRSITILQVREGWIGGALHIPSSTFHMLHPGPRYVLHEKNWDKDSIACLRRTPGILTLGEMVFINPGEGERGVARHRKGRYQILPAGQMYQFHQQDWSDFAIETVQHSYNLGSYEFLTVPRGHVATVQEKNTGLYQILEPGFTYQMSSDIYHPAQMVVRDRHEVQCGPYTVVALQEDKFTGAYRHDNGAFEIFVDATKLHWLHADDYHSLTTVAKVSNDIRKFGPNRVMTIPTGYVGILDNTCPEKGQEALEIKSPGNYLVEAHYNIRPALPTMTQPVPINSLQFSTKEQILMSMDALLVWKITDPARTAHLSMTFDALAHQILMATQKTLIKECSVFNRDQLMPTRQDILRLSTETLSPEDVETLVKQADITRDELMERIMEKVLAVMKRTSVRSGWGVEISTVEWKGFEILDDKTKQSLERLAQTQLQIQAEKANAKQRVAATEAEKASEIKRAEADAEVAMQRAQAEAAVQMEHAHAKAAVAEKEAKAHASVTKTHAEAAAQVKKIQVATESEVEQIQATAQAEVEKTRAAAVAEAKAKAQIEEAEASARTTELKAEAEAKATELKAEAEAKAISLTTEAEVERVRRLHEANASMSDPELALAMAQKYVEAVQASDQLSWKHPDAVVRMMESIKEGTVLPTPMTQLVSMAQERGSGSL